MPRGTIDNKLSKSSIRFCLYLIAGNTGEGKTTTAMALMCSLYDEDELVELILAEITEGIERTNYRGPLIKRSPVKAGVMSNAFPWVISSFK